jgi:hypothetical protein
MEETMKRIIITTAVLLGTVLTAQAATQKAPYYPAQKWMADNGAGIGGVPWASMPPGYKAIVDDAVNAIQRGSAHPRANDGACLARQRQLADDIERLVPSGPVDVRQNPAMIELRTRCMPINPNPPVDW